MFTLHGSRRARRRQRPEMGRRPEEDHEEHEDRRQRQAPRSRRPTRMTGPIAPAAPADHDVVNRARPSARACRRSRIEEDRAERRAPPRARSDGGARIAVAARRSRSRKTSAFRTGRRWSRKRAARPPGPLHLGVEVALEVLVRSVWRAGRQGDSRGRTGRADRIRESDRSATTPARRSRGPARRCAAFSVRRNHAGRAHDGDPKAPEEDQGLPRGGPRSPEGNPGGSTSRHAQGNCEPER